LEKAGLTTSANLMTPTIYIGPTATASGAIAIGSLTIERQLPLSLPEPFSQESLIGLLPIKNPSFTGRMVALAEIERSLGQAQQGIITQSVVGLGGVGKTQLVTEYVHQSFEMKRYGHIVWLDGRNPIQAYQDLGKAFHIDFESTDSEAQCINKVERLLQSRNASLLLVWDDAKDQAQMQPYLASAARLKAHCLITSRAQYWEDSSLSRISVNVFDEEEALTYFKRRFKNQTGLYQETHAKGLAKQLGCLPLALAQAAAYILKKRQRASSYSLEHYLKEYGKTKHHYKQPLTPSDGYFHATVWTTWYLSIDALRHENKEEAALLLEKCAYLEGSAIAEEFLRELTDSTDEQLHAMIEPLLDYSLVEPLMDNHLPVIKIHQLLQEVIRLHLQEEPLPSSIPLILPALEDTAQEEGPISEALLMRRYLTNKINQWTWNQREVTFNCPPISPPISPQELEAVRTQKKTPATALCKLIIPAAHNTRDHQMIALLLKQLVQTFHADERHMEQLRAMQVLFAPHIKTICNHAFTAEVGEPDAVELLFYLGNLAEYLKDTKEMQEIFSRILPYYEDFYRNHPLLGKVLGNLGIAYSALGDPQEQKNLLQRALVIFERYYGPDHVEVASTLNNLANAYGTLGDPKEEKRLLQRALRIKERHYGPEHMEVASTLNNLANAYSELGDPQEQKRLLQRALLIVERDYSSEYVKVASILGNLATAYSALGEFQSAQNSYHRALRINQHFFGEAHPEVGIVFFNLTALHFKKKEFSMGLAYLKRAHVIFLQHPNYGSTLPYTQQAIKALKQLAPQMPILESEVQHHIQSQQTGNLAFQNKNYTTAIKHWQVALPFVTAQSFLFPTNKLDAILLHERLGDAYREQDELDKAIASFTQAQIQLNYLSLQQSNDYLRVANKKNACEATLALQRGVTHYQAGNLAKNRNNFYKASSQEDPRTASQKDSHRPK
jgi:tetratricopeptide (TPR) repeat protein